MATHMVLPYQQQQLHQQEEEHLRRATWAAMAGGGAWAAPPVTCQSQGGKTWSKRTASSASNVDAESWEVRAFAEDASSSGQWPPRSYTCSFCHREFRTAQALGGHMNVHRRERAHANQLAQIRNATSLASHSQILVAKTGNEVPEANGAAFTWLQSAPAPRSSLPRTNSDISLGPQRMADLPSAPLDPLCQKSSLSSQLSLSDSGGLISCAIQASTLSTSPPSQGSTSSSNPTTISTAIIFENLSGSTSGQPAWTTGAFHPYDRSLKHSQAANLRRFSLCFSKATGRDHDENLDLELRLGQGSCTV